MGAGDYKINFYSGADYGLSPDYGKSESAFFPGIGMEVNGEPYRIKASTFGVTTDTRTSNQLQDVSMRLNTGAKTIEVSGVSSENFESVPEQHLAEINRLRKLAGVELTFHGPIIEPTGARQGWNESLREQSERQMWQAVERAQKMQPDGNIVVTFHSSAALPDPITKIKTPDGKEQIKDFWIVDETEGRFQDLQLKPDYFLSKDKSYETIEAQEKAVLEAIEKQNKDLWFRQLQGVSFHANQGADILIDKILSGRIFGDSEEMIEEFKKNKDNLLKVYSRYIKGENVNEIVKDIGVNPNLANKIISEITHADIYLRDAYQDLQKLYNDAYAVAKRTNNKEDLEKLNAFREEIKKKVTYIENPEKLAEFAEEIVKGVNVLRTINAPKTFRPLKEFAIDKGSETFANIAFNSYDKFKENSPIISIENPPAGGGLSRAEDLRKLVEETRRKLTRKLVEEKKMSEERAQEIAQKIVGVTWDVGHINMIRKFGYSSGDVIKETQKIAPLVKHVHLSDNFGMEHTELPMGMGNVPIKPMLEAIQNYNKQVKKIIETGGAWYRDFKISPFKETLRAFGSPVYGMHMAPYWNQISNSAGGYYIGQGRYLPETHFSTYGAGFSNMPTELGGQMSGRSRVSGDAID